MLFQTVVLPAATVSAPGVTVADEVEACQEAVTPLAFLVPVPPTYPLTDIAVHPDEGVCVTPVVAPEADAFTALRITLTSPAAAPAAELGVNEVAAVVTTLRVACVSKLAVEPESGVRANIR